MKFKATEIHAKDLKPGDLFSGYLDCWLNPNPKAVGAKVYIRTDVPCPKEQEDNILYRIKIDVGDDNANKA